MVCARYSSDPHASPAGGRLHGVDQAEAIMERGPDGAMISSTRSGDGDVLPEKLSEWIVTQRRG